MGYESKKLKMISQLENIIEQIEELVDDDYIDWDEYDRVDREYS